MTLTVKTHTSYEISTPRGWVLTQPTSETVTIHRTADQMTEPLVLSGSPFSYTFNSTNQFVEFVDTLVQLKEEFLKAKLPVVGTTKVTK